MIGVVLVGGEGRRLGGVDKPRVVIGGRMVLVRVLEVVRPLFAEVVLVADRKGRYTDFGVRVVEDVFPGRGVLGGIYSGLAACREAVFCFAGDMPFLSRRLIEYMVGLHGLGDVVVPCWQGRLHTLHAIYSPACLEPMRQALEAGDLRVVSFFPRVRVRQVAPEEIKAAVGWAAGASWALFNVNTPEDLAQAEELAERKRKGLWRPAE